MPVIKGGEVHSGLTASRVFRMAGVPTNNVTGLGVLGVGDLVVNTNTGILYAVTATNGTSTITFQVVGAQT